MIPYSADDIIEFDAGDNLVLKLKPLVGRTEYKVQPIMDEIKKADGADNSLITVMECTDKLFDEFVIGWRFKENEQNFPNESGKKASEFFNHKFKSFIVFKIVFKADISFEEKKS